MTMHSSGRFCLHIVLGALLLLASAPAWSGLFKVQQAGSELHDGIYHVQARFDLRLSKAMRSALENGVTLVFAIEVEIEHPRRFWLNEGVAHLEQRYALSYHPLTEQYLVTDLNTEIQKNFHSLGAALEYLNRDSALPTIDADLLKPGVRYIGYIRISLVRSALPLALKVKAYSQKAWRAASDWKRWRIQ